MPNYNNYDERYRTYPSKTKTATSAECRKREKCKLTYKGEVEDAMATSMAQI
jgi:hypothetical protein